MKEQFDRIYPEQEIHQCFQSAHPHFQNQAPKSICLSCLAQL